MDEELYTDCQRSYLDNVMKLIFDDPEILPTGDPTTSEGPWHDPVSFDKFLVTLNLRKISRQYRRIGVPLIGPAARNYFHYSFK